MFMLMTLTIRMLMLLLAFVIVILFMLLLFMVIASPSNAPKAKLNKNLIVISKQPSEAIFFTQTIIKAVIKPKAEIPKPARNPYPHIYETFSIT